MAINVADTPSVVTYRPRPDLINKPIVPGDNEQQEALAFAVDNHELREGQGRNDLDTAAAAPGETVGHVSQTLAPDFPALRETTLPVWHAAAALDQRRAGAQDMLATRLDLPFKSAEEVARELAQRADGLARITNLNLDACGLTGIPEPVLRSMPNLRSLSLAGNALVDLPDALLGMSALRELRLDDNQISRLPEGIEAMRSLRKLSLKNNPIRALPDGICGLGELVELRVSGSRRQGSERNGLSELPEDIGCLRNLEVLDLDGNRLWCLPKRLTALTKLRTLVLSNNLLTDLPTPLLAFLRSGNCREFPSLTHFRCDGNLPKDWSRWLSVPARPLPQWLRDTPVAREPSACKPASGRSGALFKAAGRAVQGAFRWLRDALGKLFSRPKAFLLQCVSRPDSGASRTTSSLPTRVESANSSARLDIALMRDGAGFARMPMRRPVGASEGDSPGQDAHTNASAHAVAVRPTAGLLFMPQRVLRILGNLTLFQLYAWIGINRPIGLIRSMTSTSGAIEEGGCMEQPKARNNAAPLRSDDARGANRQDSAPGHVRALPGPASPDTTASASRLTRLLNAISAPSEFETRLAESANRLTEGVGRGAYHACQKVAAFAAMGAASWAEKPAAEDGAPSARPNADASNRNTMQAVKALVSSFLT